MTTGPWDSSAARAAVTALPVGYLADFDDCGGLLTYYQANALELVTPYGIGGFGMGRDGSGVAVEDNSGGGDSGGGHGARYRCDRQCSKWCLVPDVVPWHL